jgi:hypothetical protein
VDQGDDPRARRLSRVDLPYAGNRPMLVYRLPLNEVVFDFYDRLKSASSSYASFGSDPAAALRRRDPGGDRQPDQPCARTCSPNAMAATTTVEQHRGCFALFDDFVGADEDRRRDRQAEFLRGLEVDNEVELHRPLNWQIGEVGSLQDAIDIARR